MIAWRLTERRRIEDAFDGEGAFKYGGRWNRQGTRVVYAAQTLSLAVLELLVHVLPTQMKKPLFAFRVDIPDDSVELLDTALLPTGWTASPAHPALAVIGSKWAASHRSLALLVPSAVVPQENNLVLNPAHPRWAQVKIGAPAPYRFDGRLLKVVTR